MDIKDDFVYLVKSINEKVIVYETVVSLADVDRLYGKYPGKFIHFTELILLSIVWSFYDPGYLPTRRQNRFMMTPTREINALTTFSI